MRIEKLPDVAPFDWSFEDFDALAVCDCVRILSTLGYVEADDCWAQTGERNAISIFRLTWLGAELVSSLRNEAVWARLKEKLQQGDGSCDLAQLKRIVAETIEEMAGEP